MKNVKRILSVLVFFTLTFSVQAQNIEPQTEEEKTELSQAELEEAKSRFKEFLNSPNYKKSQSLRKALTKNQDICSLPDFRDDSSFIPWMKENLHLSEFKTLEEAISVRNEWMEVAEKVSTKNDPRLYQLMQKATREQGIAIIQPLLDQSEKDYGNAVAQ